MRKKPKHVPVTPVQKPGDILLTFKANILVSGSLLLVVGGTLMYYIQTNLRWLPGALAVIGGLFAALIGYGAGTLQYIREARGHFQETGDLPDWFIERASRWYCYRAGVVALVQQEKRVIALPKKFLNWMTPTFL